MRVQYISDIHLEIRDNYDFLKANPIHCVGDVIILCGDIVSFGVMDKRTDFINYVSDNFESVYWIPGNHEYYFGKNISHRFGVVDEQIKTNVRLVNNVSVVQEDCKFIFSTLWSKISDANSFLIQRRLADFRAITIDGNPFNVSIYNSLHNDSLAFIQKELEQTTEKKIAVFTHHCPTFMNYPTKHKGDVLNEAFATELFDMIESSDINYWVYGHHHSNVDDFIIGNTKLLTNQMGYCSQYEHQSFDSKKYFEI